jgi:hypothetical protein
VSDVCKTTYEEIKKDKKHRYVVFFIRDEKQIDVEVIGKIKHFTCLRTDLHAACRSVIVYMKCHVTKGVFKVQRVDPCDFNFGW